jgi:hypothetical protein
MNYHQQSGVTGPLVTENLKSPACNSSMGAMPDDPKEARAHAFGGIGSFTEFGLSHAPYVPMPLDLIR